MSTETMAMVALIVALVVGVALIALYKRKIIEGDTISGVAEVLQALPVTMGSGLFGKILEYIRTAVLTVEQMVKNGTIQRDDNSRKEKAMALVAQAANVDDVPFGMNEQEVASACIEACVQELPRNQGK